MADREIDTARELIRATLGVEVRIEGREFPSGALAITVRRGRHTIVIDGRPPHEWALSIDPPEEESFFGHDHASTSLADLLARAARTLPPLDLPAPDPAAGPTHLPN